MSKAHIDSHPVQDHRRLLFAEPVNKNKGTDLEKPWRRGDWLIWPHTILGNVEISDCNDTVEGICYRDTSIEECMDRCPADSCGAGIFVKFKNGSTMCAPMRTGIHPKLSPLYRLKNQSFYDLNPNLVEVSVFVNTNLFPFPPNFANTVFFGDVLSIEDPTTGMKLETSSIINDGPGPCVLKKNATSVLSLQPMFRTANPIVHDRPVVYGDNFILTIAATSYIMQVDPSGIQSLVWKEALGVFGGSSLTFSIAPVDPTKKIGDLVTYSDIVSFSYSGIGLVAVRKGDNKLYLSTSPSLMSQKVYNKYKMENTNGHTKSSISTTDAPFNVYFKFSSLMKGYYCDEGLCKTVQPHDITPAHYPGDWDHAPPSNVLSSGTYKGKGVFNHAGCWGMCDEVKPGKGKGTVIRLPGNQHLPKLDTSPPIPLWQREKKKHHWVVISIVVATILIMTTGIVIYIHIKKSE